VDNALELMGYTLRTAGVEIVEQRGENLPAIWGDGDQLHQVVTNLLVNAQHAMMDMPAPRRLTIATSFDASSDMVTLTLDDTGPGVPSAMRTRIFDPFFTTKPMGVGTGIGLSVCHGVIESHGGQIEVTDGPGGGARFVVQLPPATAAMTVSGEPAAPSPPSHNGRRILVVDDEPDVAQSLAEILGLDGHRVDVANCGVSALRRIGETDYDLVLTDLRMPRMDGQALYREITKNHPALAGRIAIVTGDSLEMAASDFVKEEGLQVVEKPFVPDDVSKVVNSILQNDSV
jgi:two-component system NtrC family sensor kinase